MKNALPLLFLFCCMAAGAQSYTLSTVPEALRKNASVIVHLDNTTVDVSDMDRATVKVQKIFTVVDEEGRDELMFTQYVNKYMTLDEAEVKVYDEHGKQLSRHKKKEMQTVAVGEGLIEDGYMTYYRIPPASYPVTIEFDYTLKLKSLIYIPGFWFMGAKQSVVESSYTLKYPSGINIRYKPKRINISPELSDDGKYKTCKWTVKDLPALPYETGAAASRDRYPYVNIVADQFTYYGSQGDLSSWKNFGAWIRELYQGLDELPADRQQFFRELVKDAPTDEEKTRRIYDYLQHNFRYVSIQLGIGGLKPFSASFTDQKKYGDCKALSNYMKAALKSVGIRSYVAIINSDHNSEPVDPDFPANDFNHVILCVPGAKDSTWLECTSSTAEFGKLGTFTENRNALLITEDGGVLVPTPRSQASANTLTTHTVVSMEDDLSGQADIRFSTTGEFDEMISDVLKNKKDDQKEFIVFYLGYKQPDDFLFEKIPAQEHDAELKMSIRKVPEFTAGDKYFMSPRINKFSPGKLPSADNRKQDFYFYYPFEQRDTTVLKLPSQFKPDVLPNEKTLSTPYTQYQSKSWYSEKDNALYTSTTLVLKKHKIPAADYASVKSFFDEVSKDEAQRVVVKKSGGQAEEKRAF